MFVHFITKARTYLLLGPLVAQGAWHHSNKKENAMDFGLILLATNTLMAIFIFFVLNLIWKQ